MKYGFLVVGPLACHPCGEDMAGSQAFSPDRHWTNDYGDASEVNVSSSSWVDLTVGDNYFQAALDKGFISESYPIIINLEQTGTLTWVADRLGYDYSEGQNGEVTVLHREYVMVVPNLGDSGTIPTTTVVASDSFPEGFLGYRFSY